MIKEVHGGNIYKYNRRMYDFSANLNPLGMPEAVKRAVTDNVDSYQSYPDPFNTELTEKISVLYGLSNDSVCPGNGAADIIFRIVLALKPEKALVIQPTFSEYEEALHMVNAKIQRHYLAEENDFTLSESVLEDIDDSCDIMFICNPNNPTGIPVSHELMIKIAEKCSRCNVRLVVDECFSEFLEDESVSLTGDLKVFENIIVLKAFTKIYAMAGLRLGFCLCTDTDVIEKIRNTLQPWAVSTVASKAGVAAIDEKNFVAETKRYVAEQRNFLISELNRLGYKVYLSKANYIFFKTEKNITEALEKKNIMIRSCSNYPSLDGSFYRIAVRTEEENTYFMKVLESITKKIKK